MLCCVHIYCVLVRCDVVFWGLLCCALIYLSVVCFDVLGCTVMCVVIIFVLRCSVWYCTAVGCGV